MKPSTPNLENAGSALFARKTKKKAMRTRMSAARPVSSHLKAGSATRARAGRSPRGAATRALSALASMMLRLALRRRAVAGQAVGRGERRRLDAVGQRCVGQVLG